MKTHLLIDDTFKKTSALAKQLLKVKEQSKRFHGYNNCKDALNLILEELDHLSREVFNEPQK